MFFKDFILFFGGFIPGVVYVVDGDGMGFFAFVVGDDNDEEVDVTEVCDLADDEAVIRDVNKDLVEETEKGEGEEGEG